MPPASVFISYAHKDNESSDPSKRWLDRLLEHLEPLNFQEQVHTWSDLDIEMGDNWHSSIQMSLENARAAVLLISQAFLASKYIRNSELPVLLKNASDKDLVIIPIILRHCSFKETLFKYPDPHKGPEEISLSSLQAANSPTSPLNSLKEHAQDKVLLSVAQRLLKLVQIPVSQSKTIEFTRGNFMEPITPLAAGAIAGLAFNEFIKSGAGELAKKSVGGAIDLIKNLRDKIETKFRGNERAATALFEVKQQGTQAALDKVTEHLEVEMRKDEAFDTEVKQIAQQIINIQNQNILTREYTNNGRDQIIVENMHGNPRIGGS